VPHRRGGRQPTVAAGPTQADHEHNLATTRSRLGDEAFAAAWAQGRSLTLEQAVAEALEEGPTPW
jgi:hypothetical protein